MNKTSSRITCAELAERLGEPNLVCLEAGFMLPHMKDIMAGVESECIPHARLFDIEDIVDPTGSAPHMAPSEELFTQKVAALGVNKDSFIVCYDRFGLFSAGRVWWMFRLFGHQKVAVLDGGLKHWQQLGLPVEKFATDTPAPGNFVAKMDSAYYAQKADVLAAISAGTAIVDARPAERFSGHAPEPREGMRAGHMPKAHSLPLSNLTDKATGKLLPLAELQKLFADIPDGQDTVFTCGSGITAAGLLFCAELIGRTGRVYDGSWAEWGSDPETPIEKSL